MDLQTATDVARNITTASAVVIGGVWAYLKFVRGRTFARRADLSITATLEQSSSAAYLSIIVTLKNAGLSKLPLSKDVRVIRLLGSVDNVNNQAGPMSWERIRTFPIFQEHEWLEAQETVSDNIVYRLGSVDKVKSLYVALRVEAVIAAPRRKITGKGIRWRAHSIIFLPSEDAVTSFDSVNKSRSVILRHLVERIIQGKEVSSGNPSRN